MSQAARPVAREFGLRRVLRAREPEGDRTLEAAFPWLLALITAVAFALRFVGLGTQSFWSDESETVFHLHQSFPDLITNVANTEVTPHLYFVLVRAWGAVFGSSETAVRSFSALVGIATVPVAAVVAGELWSRRAALLAALLVATNPMLVWYSQEARAYALLVLFATVALLYFVRAVESLRPRHLWLWGLWSAVALCTHYFAIFWIVTQAAYLCVVEHRRPGDRHTALIVSAVLLVVAIPLGGLANYQRTAPANHDPGGIAGISLVRRVGGIPKEYFLGPAQPCLARPGQGCVGPAGIRSLALGAVLVLIALVSLVGAPAVRNGRRLLIGGRLTVLVLTASGAVLLPVVLAVVGADFVTARNVICGVVPCALIIACGASMNWRGLGAALGLAAVGVVSVIAVLSSSQLERADYRGLAHRAGKPLVRRAIVMSPGMAPGIFGVYWHGVRLMRPGQNSKVGEIDVAALTPTFYAGPPAIRPIRVPAGFHLVRRVQESDYTLLRYRSPVPVQVAWTQLVPLNLTTQGLAVYVQP